MGLSGDVSKSRRKHEKGKCVRAHGLEQVGTLSGALNDKVEKEETRRSEHVLKSLDGFKE